MFFYVISFEIGGPLEDEKKAKESSSNTVSSSAIKRCSAISSASPFVGKEDYYFPFCLPGMKGIKNIKNIYIREKK